MAAQARGLLLLLCLLATLFLPGSAYGQVQASDFADIVKDDSSDVLVLFHRADSEQCMNFEPTFSQLEADSKVEGAVLSGVVFAAADVSEASALAEEYKVKALPTLMLFPKGDKGGAMYKGQLAPDDIMRWIASQLGREMKEAPEEAPVKRKGKGKKSRKEVELERRQRLKEAREARAGMKEKKSAKKDAKPPKKKKKNKKSDEEL